MSFHVLAAAIDIKRAIAAELPIPIETMALKAAGAVEGEGEDAAAAAAAATMRDATTLFDVGVRPGDEAELELVVEYAKPSEEEAEAVDVDPNAPKVLPERIDVVVAPKERGGQPRVVSVVIDASNCEKPRYKGGYRHKHMGTRYHHAEIQTMRKPREWPKDAKFTRDTQTTEARTRTIMTKKEAATQMKRKDLLINENRDAFVSAGRYVDSDEWHAIRVAATTVLQRYARGWFARKLRDVKRVERDERARARAKAATEKLDAEERRRRKEIERRMRPRTHEDFDILRHELEKWRKSEHAKIESDASADDAAKARNKQLLLRRETKLLATIDRLKVTAAAENKDARVARALDDMSTAKRWECDDGSVVEVHTPFTTRAKELQQLYNGVRLPLVTADEVRSILTNVFHP